MDIHGQGRGACKRAAVVPSDFLSLATSDVHDRDRPGVPERMPLQPLQCCCFRLHSLHTHFLSKPTSDSWEAQKGMEFHAQYTLWLPHWQGVQAHPHSLLRSRPLHQRVTPQRLATPQHSHSSRTPQLSPPQPSRGVLGAVGRAGCVLQLLIYLVLWVMRRGRLPSFAATTARDYAGRENACFEC